MFEKEIHYRGYVIETFAHSDLAGDTWKYYLYYPNDGELLHDEEGFPDSLYASRAAQYYVDKLILLESQRSLESGLLVEENL
jgi:hypothetical protein